MEKTDFAAFSMLLARTFALYPSASMSEATASAWFGHLEGFPLVVVANALERAVAASVQFPPAAPAVREHCAALGKTSLGKPQADLSLPALPEPEVELPEQLAAIRDRFKRGEIDRDTMVREMLRNAQQTWCDAKTEAG